MNRKKIDIRDCAGDIIRAMKLGILITTKVGEKVNSMTIGRIYNVLSMQVNGWPRRLYKKGGRRCRCTQILIYSFFCSLNRKFATENQ